VTIAIDLRKSWTNATVTINTINKTVPVWNQPYLSPEPDNSSFYQWGGEPSNLNIGWETAASALYNFQSDGLSGGECTVVGQTSTSIFKDLRRGFEGAAASRDDTWYLVGGVVSCHSDPSEHDCSEFNILGPMIS
jgi:hypothetical protein